MDKVTQHIDMSQHACIQLEKATQFITQALQHEVGRNHELCVVICRLEEKGAEQLESIHQLNLKIVELQKHLEQKDNSLSKAYETVTFLTTELRDLHLHLRSTNPSSPFKSGQQATVDEPMISPVAQSPLVSSSLHGPRVSSSAEEPLVLCAQQHTPPVVYSVSGQHSPPVFCSVSGQHSPPIFSRADTPLVSSFPHGFPVSSSDADPLFSSGQCSLSVSSSPVPDPDPLVPSDEHGPPEVGQVHSEAQSLMVVSATERLVEAVLSGFKTEAAFEEAEYGHRGYTQSELTSHPRPEQTFSSDADGKAELPQELEAESNMADTDNSDTDESDTEESDSDEPPPAPVSLAQLKRVSVVLVDCCGQKQQGKDEDHNQDGEMAVIGNGSSLSSMDLSESLSTSHAQIDSNEKYSCSVCGKSYQFHSQLRKHLYTHTRKCQYSCSHCGKTFNHKGNYKVHLRVHTGEKPYHCTQCDKRFAQGSSLKSHLRNHTGERPYSCALCGKGFSQKVNLTAHCCAPKNETLYHCAQCGQSFNDEKYLTEHQCSLTGDGPSQGCTQNDGSSTGRSARQKRQRTRTGVKLLDWTDCDKKFALNSSLTLHSRTHTGERPYQCTHCGKRFASKSYLDVHLRIHTGEKPYSCSVCGKAFNQLSNLKSHLFTHTKDWPHKCNQCGKGFTRPGLLKQHKCTHVGESGDAVV